MLWHKAQGAGGTGGGFTFNEVTITAGYSFEDFSGEFGFVVDFYGVGLNYGSISQDFVDGFDTQQIYTEYVTDASGTYVTDVLRILCPSIEEANALSSAVTGFLIDGTPVPTSHYASGQEIRIQDFNVALPWFSFTGQTRTFQFY